MGRRSGAHDMDKAGIVVIVVVDGKEFVESGKKAGESGEQGHSGQDDAREKNDYNDEIKERSHFGIEDVALR